MIVKLPFSFHLTRRNIRNTKSTLVCEQPLECISTSPIGLFTRIPSEKQLNQCKYFFTHSISYISSRFRHHDEIDIKLIFVCIVTAKRRRGMAFQIYNGIVYLKPKTFQIFLITFKITYYKNLQLALPGFR